MISETHSQLAAETDNTRAKLSAKYERTRQVTVALCEPLEIEDHVVQSCPEVSPPKWHLAHTTWFFETFLLKPFSKNYRVFHPRYDFLFNSYYEGIGAPFPRPERGILSRPTVRDVLAYRTHVDQHLLALLRSASDETRSEIERRTLLGLHHEQQHQELLLMDIKYNFSLNPLRPAYNDRARKEVCSHVERRWIERPGGTVAIGAEGDAFAFDNESPRHEVLLRPHAIANRLVTNGEFLEFVEANCYEDPALWFADGIERVRKHSWSAPLYWEMIDGEWHEFTLRGLEKLDENAPVVHVSYFEADAYARFKGLRLPTEAEWEVAARDFATVGNSLESERLHPFSAMGDGEGIQQLFGDVWELTQTPYMPYPGFQPFEGAMGEYNGKFMCNQFVQRGGSCLTPRSHMRLTYRNFFYADQRWNTQGFRPAKDISP